MMTVNQRIRVLRKEKNMTVSALAAKVGVYQSVLTRYEKGTIQYIPLDLIDKLAEALDCTVDDLIEDDNRYTQKKKKRRKHDVSSEEYELIMNYRQLPAKIQSLVKEMCSLRISVDN